MADRLSLRLRVFLFFAALGAGGVAALVAGLWLAHSRLGLDATDAAVRTAFVQGGLIAGFGLLGLVAWVWLMFDTHVARALDGLAAAIRARAHADIGDDIDQNRARYLGDLTPAAAAVARSLSTTRNALAESIACETKRLSAEKARLETLLADVPVGMLLCTGDHKLVFYNRQAVDLLGTGQAPGRARGIFEYLREGPVRHAYKRLYDANDRDAVSDLLIATTGAARVLAGRMRVLARRDPGVPPGYVLTLRDVTADMAAHTSRKALLAEVFDRVRRPAANLQTVIGVMAEDGGAPPPELSAALLQEVRKLGAAITELGMRYDAGRVEWRPLAQTRSDDLMDSLRARIEAAGLSVEIESPDLILRCDGFELVALLAGLAERLAAAGVARAFRVLLVEEDGPGARIDLEWDGAPLSVADLDRWLDEAVDPAAGALTGRAVLQMHGTEAWPDLTVQPGRSRLRMPVPEARRAVRSPPLIARAVVYDFDLLSKARNARVAENWLEDLTYVVFDTETTGLVPSSDEIVQIAAVRVVNGRRVEGEVFDTLVDPRRLIPPGSTEVHGITDAMVRGAPGIAEAGRGFTALPRARCWWRIMRPSTWNSCAATRPASARGSITRCSIPFCYRRFCSASKRNIRLMR
jgi:DNA polymerase-3 subunit epsilon